MNIQIEEHEKIIIFKINGDFSLSNIRQTEQIWEEQIHKKPNVIAIDCEKMEFIDSSAIGTLVKFLNSSDKFNFKMVFINLSSSIIKIFKTAKLNQIFSIVTKEQFEEEYLK